MDPIVYIGAAAVVLALLLLVTFLKQRGANNGDGALEGQAIRAPQGRQVETVGGVRQRRGPRNRMAAARRQDPDSEDDIDEDNEYLEEMMKNVEGKVGAKKRKKIEEKARRKQEREEMEEAREEQKKRDEKDSEQKKKEEERLEAEEKAREEEEKKKKEEEEKREYEEYLKMKEQFTVDEEGVNEEENEDTESLFQEFVDHIKSSKVVMLEDLASHFRMKTQDAIDRVTSLLADGYLTGSLDDRGKFIYITMEEYEAVAKFIKQRGRVSISELAESSNKLINLDPDNRAAQREL